MTVVDVQGRVVFEGARGLAILQVNWPAGWYTLRVLRERPSATPNPCGQVTLRLT